MSVDAADKAGDSAPAGRLSAASGRMRAIQYRVRMAQFLANPQIVLSILVAATLLLVASFTIILAMSVFVAHHTYVLPRLYSVGIVLAYVILIAVLVRHGKTRAAAWMLLGFYTLLGSVILLIWGINVPSGVLILGFVIVLAGILLGSRWTLPVTAAVIAILTAIELVHALNVINPDTTSLARMATFLDVGDYGTLFVIFAVVSWLSGRQKEQSLEKAVRAEADLQEEKRLLAIRLEERTQSLRQSQLEEMRQLYRFAELGQLGTVVLHDLANNLTTLTLDIDDIEQQSRSSEALNRARSSIGYLDTMVAQARCQLRQNDRPVAFDAVELIYDTITGLRPKAERSKVIVRLEADIPDGTFIALGDPVRLAQVVTILVSNAIDAYEGIVSPRQRRAEVLVALTVVDHMLAIAISDFGKGIGMAQRKRIFEPFHSTKPNGMGIGLYIANEIIEGHFKGSIELDPSRELTRFTVQLHEHVVKAHETQ